MSEHPRMPPAGWRLPFIALRDCGPPALGEEVTLKVGLPDSVWALCDAWRGEKLVALARLRDPEQTTRGDVPQLPDLQEDLGIAEVKEITRDKGWFNVKVEGIGTCQFDWVGPSAARIG